MASFRDTHSSGGDEAMSSQSNSRFREPPPHTRSFTDGGGDASLRGHVDTGFQGVEETLMLMRDARWKYVPRTQTHGGKKTCNN
jgi:hypothetical protein